MADDLSRRAYLRRWRQYCRQQGYVMPSSLEDRVVYRSALRLRRQQQLDQINLESEWLNNPQFVELLQDPDSFPLIEEEFNRLVAAIPPPRVITNMDNWSELSKYFVALHPTGLLSSRTERPNVEVRLTCSRCQKKLLRMPSWLSEDEVNGSSSYQFEDLCVLPCGHLIGHECFQKYSVDHLDHLLPHEMHCPIPTCGARLTYTLCGHRLEIPRIGRITSTKSLRQVRLMAPFTRNYRLLPGTTDSFVDLSTWPKELATAENNWGVGDRCADCSLETHRQFHIDRDGSYFRQILRGNIECSKSYDC